MSEISDWTNGVVAIIAGGRRPVGTGFVVSADGLMVTCAHVLEQAGWPYGNWERPVTVRFKATGRSARAFVLEGCFRSKIEGDTAVLALEDGLPEEAAVLPLAAARGIAKHEVSLWGYPPQRPQGLGGDSTAFARVQRDDQICITVRNRAQDDRIRGDRFARHSTAAQPGNRSAEKPGACTTAIAALRVWRSYGPAGSFVGSRRVTPSPE